MPLKSRVKALPASFRSLYRVFLRTSSAAVLHHPGATGQLRRLWKPEFYGAVHVILRIREGRNKELVPWLAEWGRRMDNTLSFMYNCSQKRGLSHRVMRNLNLLALSNRYWAMQRYRSSTGRWRGQLALDAATYSVASVKPSAKMARVAKARDMGDMGWGALDEVVQMAEGREGMTLGRVFMRKPRP